MDTDGLLLGEEVQRELAAFAPNPAALMAAIGDAEGDKEEGSKEKKEREEEDEGKGSEMGTGDRKREETWRGYRQGGEEERSGKEERPEVVVEPGVNPDHAHIETGADDMGDGHVLGEDRGGKAVSGSGGG